METFSQISLIDLPLDSKVHLSGKSFVSKQLFTDACGSPMTVLTLCNGLLTYTVLPERGLDIGDIFLGDERFSWERDMKYLLHPGNVDLSAGSGAGWINGFYPAVASIGPELFGTPGEGYTLHGTGSYSPADTGSVKICFDDREITVEGIVPIKGYGPQPRFEKKVSLKCRYSSPVLLREELTRNLSQEPVVLDDGLHIQLCGNYLDEGGRYVLPAKTAGMLLRDSAPPERDPLHVYGINEGSQPIRCYQYVPQPVPGLESIGEISPYLPVLQNPLGITAEMLINEKEDAGAYVIRPLDCFPRSLIAKEVSGSRMFALEPCRTRPNRMSQKITDGEAFFLAPQARSTTRCLLGVSRCRETVLSLERLITSVSIP